MGLIGLVEFDEDEPQDVYGALDNLTNPILLKIQDEKVTASTGLGYLTQLSVNVVNPEDFWQKSVCTFRIQGELQLFCQLESPDLLNAFGAAKKIVLNQAAYSVGKDGMLTFLPRQGTMMSEISSVSSQNVRISEIIKNLKGDIEAAKEDNSTYFQPNLSLIQVKLLFDQTKTVNSGKGVILVREKCTRCKYFEHTINIDVLVIIPQTMSAQYLHKKFNSAVNNQLLSGFYENICHQLGNSISAEKPEVFHFWPNIGQGFISALYPRNTTEDRLQGMRLELHEVFNVKEKRPYFRRSAAIFLKSPSLISPHVSLVGKFPETEVIPGHYEYKHYMQDEFNDDGWGCAYRSLQTIVSWFRLQGFTSRPIPTHKEIQECLVSLGDKPASMVGSKQWIGSTEVGFVLEAMFGVTCRVMNMSSGPEMASRAADLQSHFKVHGTPVMIGGGVLAHTIIGISRDPAAEENVQFLVLDPHYTGKDDLSTILNKKWVGWKDNSFWSKKDFYNICMPLLPSTI
jgi:hypothetical protein